MGLWEHPPRTWTSSKPFPSPSRLDRLGHTSTTHWYRSQGVSLMENHPFSLINTPQSKPYFSTGSALFRIGGWDRKLSVSLVAHGWTTTVLLLKMTGLRPLNDNWVKKWKTHCQSWRCPLGPKYIYIYTVYRLKSVLQYDSRCDGEKNWLTWPESILFNPSLHNPM